MSDMEEKRFNDVTIAAIYAIIEEVAVLAARAAPCETYDATYGVTHEAIRNATYAANDAVTWAAYNALLKSRMPDMD